MAGSELEGLSILIVEDELLVAMDIADAFESTGAVTAIATTLHQALIEVEGEDLKAAVVDLGKVSGSCATGAQVAKPERPEVLVSMVEALLRGGR